MGKYPIGIQDFREIRVGGYTYIDKTEQIYQLLDTGKYYFLSRPRRFGKSLLLSTIEHLYQGEKSLFEGLWIERHWDWSKRYPVVHIKMSRSDYQRLGLEQALLNEVERAAVRLGIELRRVTLKERFEELLALGSKQGQVVLLVDEYDKPMIDYLSSLDRLEENRSILKQFYSIIKDSDSYLRFFILTGVSRFSKVSIFSDLNNISDISVLPNYNDLVGISEQEVESHFIDRIKEIAEKQDKSYESLKEEIKEWYNGYNFSGEETLYNPFSLLSFMRDGVFNNYWFSTGTPTFLVELIRNHGQYVLDDNAFVSLLTLGDFDTSNMDYTSVLFQTGYLTLKEIHFEEGWCRLQYPNREVQASLEQLLLGAYRYGQAGSGLPSVPVICGSSTTQTRSGACTVSSASTRCCASRSRQQSIPGSHATGARRR